MAIEIMLVVGTRPQIIKSAPIIHASRLVRGVRLQVVHTGQHYDYEMSKSFFGELSLPSPRASLNVGSGSHAWQTAEIMKRLEKVIRVDRPDYVLVPGDTNSTLAAALVAAKLRVPVAHVESGARSYDMTMPEEINRVVADHSSNLLFAPTRNCLRNLRKEGISRSRVALTGDTHYDAFCKHAESITDPRLLRRIDIDGPFAYTTIHRAENVDNRRNLTEIVRALLKLKKLQIVFSVHPRTESRLRKLRMLRRLRESGNVKIESPVTYLQSLALAWRSTVVITDSGGLQREAFWLGRPCVVLRKTTEWPETLHNKRTMLSPPVTRSVISKTHKVIAHASSKCAVPRADRNSPFGDGHASERIVGLLLRRLVQCAK